MKDARPARYQVARKGSPDPVDSEYYVLDLVHDFEARVAVAKLIGNYERLGQKGRADDARAALEATVEAHEKAVIAKTPKTKKGAGRVSRAR